ncbi:peptidase family M48-domain-containing protein [Fomitopsis betulina]|nr:peptidase family M48-domain-containing protein [Fomitopsis betulina]
MISLSRLCALASPLRRCAARPTRAFSSSGVKRAGPRYVRFDSGPQHPGGVPRWDTRTRVAVGVIAGGGVYYVTHLERIEETGRWRFMDVSPQLEARLAKQAHNSLVAQYGDRVLPPNHPISRHVRRVVERILEASHLGTLAPPEPTHGRTLTLDPDSAVWPAEQSIDLPPTVGGKQWNLMVVNDDRMVNAAATFGDIIVFTGILPVAKDEEGLAAVLGHEIGHAVLRHASERTSSFKILLVLLGALSIIGLDISLSQTVLELLYELPNSRKKELEADKVGLKLMAKACYDPAAAPAMFVRLAQLEGGGSGPAFLATHPATTKRIKKLERLLPEAYATRAASPQCAGLNDSYAAFRDAFSQGGWRAPSDGGLTWGW